MNMTAEVRRTVLIDRRISLTDAAAIAEGQARIALAEDADRRCADAFQRLQNAIAENRHVYGITTGFGPLANRLIGAQHGEALQQNLVYHLSSGVGAPFGWATARAIVLARVMALVQGASGVRPETLARLLALLNSDLAPEIPSRGTVGASGDLTPLAHIVLCLQGRGRFIRKDGTLLSASDALERLGFAPLDLSHRDGLALVNGTSAMTGLGVLNVLRLERALDWSTALSGAMAEALGGRLEAWHRAFSDLRPHPGQVRATERLAAATEGSERIERVPLARNVFGHDINLSNDNRAGQDAYSLRCAPQVIGATWDMADWHRRIVEAELHSVTDNPIFTEGADAPALHGGNFMGVHVALASDAAGLAATVLAGFHERQIARLTDEKLNGGLPPFLTGGPAGLTSGLMGAQVTATALLAEMRCFGPASVHSISTNGANQDVVSQGTIAARLLSDKIDLLFQIQAILSIGVAQAIELADRSDERRCLSRSARELVGFVRESSGFLDDDRPLGGEIEVLARRLERKDPPIAEDKRNDD